MCSPNTGQRERERKNAVAERIVSFLKRKWFFFLGQNGTNLNQILNHKLQYWTSNSPETITMKMIEIDEKGITSDF